MADKNSELLARLRATFRLEAEEHVKAMSSGLLELEKLPAGGAQHAKIIEAVFRQAHSLKGAARAVNFVQIEDICQPLESIFAALRDRKMSLSTSLADLLHQTITLVEALANGDIEAARKRQSDVSGLVRQLERALGRAARSRAPAADKTSAPSTGNALVYKPIPSQSAPTDPNPKQPSPAQAATPPTAPAPHMTGAAPGGSTATTVRISTKKLDAVMRLTEEMLASRLSAAQRAADIREAVQELHLWRKRSADIQALLRPKHGLSSSPQASGDIHRFLTHLADEQVRLRALEDQLTATSRAADRDGRILASMTNDLQQRVRDMQLLPCSTLLDMFARQARELARELGKEVALSTQGSDIEVDRRLLDEIKDPLIHLVRNCIDHGIEPPAQRRQAGKAPQGKVRIAVAQKDSGKINITVADDGRGIDSRRLKSVAIERGMLTEEEAEALSDTGALELIFRSGISTSTLITDMSGRGLGMAIVRDKIEQLGGHIDIESAAGDGTCFQIVLPVNVATFRGIQINVANQSFIIPSANLDRVVCIKTDSVHSVNNRDTIGIDGQALALVWLNDVLGLPRQPPADSDSFLVVILGRGNNRVGFRVDAVVGEQEVLVKGLGPQLRRVHKVAGASIMGNGQVVPVLNVPDLLDAVSAPPAAIAAQSTAPAQTQLSVLVVEDSITSRSLMKNILETAGFRVATAVDGIDAYTTLKTQAFDLVVSDVDMPRMNGFDLTAKLRADKDLNEMPVVLLTTLDSREDRERGVEVGANAYIVKSSFDQSNLLEVIQRLI